MKGAEATAVAVYLARTGMNLLEIRDYINKNYYPINFTLDSIRDEYKFDVSCQGSVPQALEGMTEAGWDSTAETVASDLEDAINKALQIHSPSKRMMPIGEYASAGIAEGVSGYDFSSSGSAVASAVENAVSGNLTRTSLRTVGVNAMLGLAAGINSGHLTVVAAMKKAARAAVNAAKQELKIASPSGVFRDEVGVMVMKGLGEGALDESKETAKTIRNATRYLTEAAVEGRTSGASNNRTYNSNSNISFPGSNFYLRDEQDIYSLAVEIASLTRRQQRGKGFRMA